MRKARQPAVFTDGYQLALKNFSLPFQSFQLALAGMALRRDRGLKVLEARFGPGRLRGFSSSIGLIFKPLQATVEEFESALHASRLLPWPFAIKCGECGDGLGESAQVDDKRCDKLGEGTAAWPGFSEQSFQGFFRVVVGQPRCAAGVGQEAS